MWVYRSNINDDHPVILFDYHKTRKTDCLRKFVNGFHGVIVSDGYASYHQLEKEMPESITSAGCWVHVRRNFFNIIKAAGGKDRKRQSTPWQRKEYRESRKLRIGIRNF